MRLRCIIRSKTVAPKPRRLRRTDAKGWGCPNATPPQVGTCIHDGAAAQSAERTLGQTTWTSGSLADEEAASGLLRPTTITLHFGSYGPDTAIAIGAVPAAKGEPATGVSAPSVGSMLYAETLLDPLFST